jgi:hypothetical protein
MTALIEGVFFSKDKKQTWLQTYSGKRVSVLDPQTEEIDIEDVAEAVSKLCRYNGHCKEFYSVAQHCVLGAQFALSQYKDVELAKEFLLHDATEAYVGDMIRPVKIHNPTFNRIEDGMWEAVSKRFNLPREHSADCHNIDNIMLVWEKRDLLPNSEEWPGLPDITLYDFPKMECWDWENAKDMYLDMYEMLFESELSYAA